MSFSFSTAKIAAEKQPPERLAAHVDPAGQSLGVRVPSEAEVEIYERINPALWVLRCLCQTPSKVGVVLITGVTAGA